MQVEALRCQSCGGALKIVSSVCQCEYCGVTNIICGETGNYIDLLNKANSLRQHCEFDKAFKVYDEILESNPPFADILWSQTLCEYGIEYVQDPVSSKYIPTLHRIKDESITASQTFIDALELCDEEQKEKLTAAAEEIYKIQKDYLNIAANERPYDVFICYKETEAETKSQTKDSAIASQLYDKLLEYGYKVFFSKVTLRDKIGIEFEPYIFAALKSATAMVVIGTKPEYFEATWVKNEWSRFLRLKEDNKDKQIFFACDKVEDLPKAFSLKQAQLLGEKGAIDNLAANIDAFVSTVKNGGVRIVSARCTNCNAIQEVDPTKEAAICTKCKKPYVVSEGISKMEIQKRKMVKCPHCGREQERNMYGCIYCHKEF